jgi:hypothetical protein
MSSRRFLPCITALLGLLCFGTARISAAEASGVHVEAILVWATHSAKTNDAGLKELEPQLVKKLRKAYKWDLYYEVKRKEATVSARELAKVPISEKCTLELKNLGEERFEVHLIGKGKPVSRTVDSLAHGHIIILGGDDKNDTAWLIIIRQVPAKR